MGDINFMNNRNKKTAFITVLLMVLLFQPGNLYAADLPSPVVMLSSYNISGNLLTDKIITLHLVLTNTSHTRNVNDVLISYTSANDIFLPAYGVSNQFFVPVISADSNFEYDLHITVNNALPNDLLYFDFIVSFPDGENGTATNTFFISESVKSSNVIQLLGIEAVGINSLADNSSIVSFKATVINHGNFLTRSPKMILNGVNSDFTISIPLEDINPGNHLITDFHLTVFPDFFPKFDVLFNYTDINGANYFSDPQRITVYINNLFADDDFQNVEKQSSSLFRKVGLLLFFLSLTGGGVILFIKLRKKKGF